MKPLAPLFVALFLFNLSPRDADAAVPRHELPARGVIRSPKAGLNLREAPPSATAFSYRLADKVCAPQNGTEFLATARTFIANGEIWYRVRIEPQDVRQDDRFPCPADRPVTGWMVAKTTTGWKVDILQEGLTAVPTEGRRPVDLESNSSTETESTEEQTFSLLLDYLLLLLGTAAALVVVTIESTGAISPSRWLSRFVVFEFAVLAIVNGLTAALLIDKLLVTDDPNFLFELFQILQGTDGGFALLGFLLSIVLLRFIAFARNNPTPPRSAPDR